MRNSIRIVAALFLTAMPVFAQPLPEGAIARVGSTRFRGGWATCSIRFSADGKWLLAEGLESATVWDFETGKQIIQTLTPANSRLAFARETKLIRIVESAVIRDLDALTGKVIRTRELERQSAADAGVMISPDGRYAMYALTESIGALVDLESGKVVQTFQDGGLQGTDYVFSSNGKHLAIGLKNKINCYDTATGKIEYSIPQPSKATLLSAVAPDGTRIAMATHELVGDLVLWNGPAGKALWRTSAWDVTSSAVAFTNDGQQIAVSDSRNGLIRLYNAESGKNVQSLNYQGRFLSTVAFSPNGQIFAAAHADWGVTLFDVASGKQLTGSSDPSGEIREIRFTDRDQNFLVIADDITIRDWRTNRIRQRLTNPRVNGCERIEVSPDGRMLARANLTRAADSNVPGIQMIELKTGRIEREIQREFLSSFSPDSHFLLTHSLSEDLNAWSLSDRRKTMLQAANARNRESLALGVNGDWFSLTGISKDVPIISEQMHSLRFCDLSQGSDGRRAEIPRLEHQQNIISPNGRFVALSHATIGERETTLYIWDTQTRKACQWEELPEEVSRFRFSPDSSVLAIADSKKTLRLSEVATGRERRQFHGHQKYIQFLAFAADNRYLAAASSDAPIFIWDTWQPTGKLDPAKIAWENLANSDAKVAFQTMCRMVAQPADGVAILKSNLKPASKLDAQKVHDWIADLTDKQFAVREKASAELANVADCYEFSLRQELEKANSAESRRRLQLLLDRQSPSGERLRQSRSVEVLERIATPDALAVLRDLAAGAEGAALTLDAQAALRRSR